MAPKKSAKKPAKSSNEKSKSPAKAKSALAPMKATAKALSKLTPKTAAPISADLDNDDEDSDAGVMPGMSTATPTLQREEGASPTASMTTKNFRNHPDMENFFRFIYENDLRIEALKIIDEIIVDRHAKKNKSATLQ